MKKDDKSKLLEEKLPIIDFYVLKSKTIKILLTSTAVTSLGMNAPVFYLVGFNKNIKHFSLMLINIIFLDRAVISGRHETRSS